MKPSTRSHTFMSLVKAKDLEAECHQQQAEKEHIIGFGLLSRRNTKNTLISFKLCSHFQYVYTWNGLIFVEIV